MRYNQFLLNDFYKITHLLQYPGNITKLTSYLTPRGSRLKDEGIDEVVFFGLSGYVQDYVENGFNENFFDRKWEDIAAEIREVLVLGLGYPDYLVEKTCEKLKALHELGYLPVKIAGVPEGTFVPMGVPCVEISSTDDRFPWVGQALEASLSAAIWHPMVSATIANKYRNIAREAFVKTVDDGINEQTAMCDFSMRGQESNESAVTASAGWLTSMWNSSTVMARSYIKEHYSDNSDDVIVRGLTSTEHSVMCTHACMDGGCEKPTFEYLFNLYKDVSFAAVSDSYDFWNVLTNILPEFKDVITERGKRGKFIGVRHDSADPVEAVCGIPCYKPSEVRIEVVSDLGYKIIRVEDNEVLHCPSIRIVNDDGTDLVYNFASGVCGEGHDPAGYIPMGPSRWEDKGMVETMWELFGGTYNTKGYKVLNPGIKAVYGDSITVTRAKQIYERLENKGFAANNVSLGVGSFSFQCLESSDGNKLMPFTRDTFSIAIKNSYAKYVDENGNESELLVFKSPKGFDIKKSQKGLCYVYVDRNAKLAYKDKLFEKELEEQVDSAFLPYFYNGKSYIYSFNEIRYRVDVQNEHRRLNGND